MADQGLTCIATARSFIPGIVIKNPLVSKCNGINFRNLNPLFQSTSSPVCLFARYYQFLDPKIQSLALRTLKLINLVMVMAQGVDIGKSFFGQEDHFLTKTAGVGNFISIILSNALVAAGLILLFLLIFGGISIVIGAGQENPEAAARRKKAASAALVGFIIIFASYWIMRIIEVLTGVSILGGGL